MARKELVLVLVLMMTGCAGEAGPHLLPHPVPDQQVPSSFAGVSLEILDIRPEKGRHEVSYELSNHSLEALEYGGYASLEKKTDDSWFGVIYSDAVFYRDPGFKDSGETLLPGEKDRMTLDTGDLGTVLSPGTYRIVKTVSGIDGLEISVGAKFEVK